MSTKIYVGNALEVLPKLEVNSVHCSVSSPPYFGLRAYQGSQQCEWPEIEYAPMSGLLPIRIPGCDPDCEHEWGPNLPPSHPGQVEQTKWKNARAAGHGQTAPSGNYCQKCGGWRGALGNEPTIEMYIGHLVAIYREVYKVLRENGVAFVVMGDSFSSSPRGNKPGDHSTSSLTNPQRQNSMGRGKKANSLLAQGNLMMVPHRFALALQADGWVIRNDLVWQKKSPMPESVSGWRWERHKIKVGDRRNAGLRAGRAAHGDQNDGGEQSAPIYVDCPGCPKCEANDGYVLKRGSWRHTRAHEFVIHMVKKMQYFADQEKVREALAESSTTKINQPTFHTQEGGLKDYGPESNRSARKMLENLEQSRAGRNPRSVLTPKPSPSGLKHFAIFPSSLIEPLIKATCPDKCCPVCGKGWAPIIEKKGVLYDGTRSNETVYTGLAYKQPQSNVRGPGRNLCGSRSNVIDYRPTCECGCEGLQPGDLETISTPIGKRVAKDPSPETGRAGYNRLRDPDEGTRMITRYEQRMYAQQLKNSPHRSGMESEAGTAFAHYIRTDKSGARPAPQDLLEKWIGYGWIEEIKVPKGKELAPVPGTVLDPFSGAGTTGLVASRLGLNSILIEISEEYAEMARERIFDDAPLLNRVSLE